MPSAPSHLQVDVPVLAFGSPTGERRQLSFAEFVADHLEAHTAEDDLDNVRRQLRTVGEVVGLLAEALVQAGHLDPHALLTAVGVHPQWEDIRLLGRDGMPLPGPEPTEPGRR